MGNRCVRGYRLILLMSAGFILIDIAEKSPLLAAEAGESSGLEEIVVTATRREERLEDVPISVAVFSQEKLDVQGVRTIDDLTRLTPGITFERNGVGASGDYNDEITDINIRGIDSTAGTPFSQRCRVNRRTGIVAK